MKRDDRSPKAYRASVTGKQSDLLETIRAAILRAVPDIEEGIQHGMLDYPGLANLAAQQDYVSLYVLPAALDRHRDKFAGVNAGKSCLRFRRVSQVDDDLLRDLLLDVRAARS